MRVAQVAPLFERVPPRLYGGTERLVHYLTETLVAKGHEVTLFASADSRTSARLVPAPCEALRLAAGRPDPTLFHVLMLDEVARRAAEFDVIHFHVDYLHFPLTRVLGMPHVTTVHGRLDLPELQPLYRRFDDLPLVSISDAQRAPLPFARWAGTVHHGLPADLYRVRTGAGGYVAFLGRVSPEKRVDRAIEIARRAGVRLRIAAKVDPADREYHATRIRPLLDDPYVEFIGEIGEEEKEDFLGDARALLFPIDWPEPFGLVMIEAMACGTPVVAWRCGSVPEVIDDGHTGLIVESIDEAVRAVERAGALDRAAIRRTFERRFTAERMVDDYLAVYDRLVSEGQRAHQAA